MVRHYFLANWSRMNAQSAAADSFSAIVLHRSSCAATVGNLHINTVLGDTHPYLDRGARCKAKVGPERF